MQLLHKNRARLAVCATLLVSALGTQAEVRLPALFSDNMVLQQGKPTRIWGWVDSDSKITIEVAGHSAFTRSESGAWMAKLPPLKAGGPCLLKVSDETSQVVLTNVLVGEVWVCSGQSNMEWPLERTTDADQAIASATNSRIRFFKVDRGQADRPNGDVRGQWVESSPETARGFSAVAYYFGRDLAKARQVPVGLIGSYWGGSPAEAWTSLDVLQSKRRYQEEILLGYNQSADAYDAALLKYNAEKQEAKAAGSNFDKQPPRAPWKPTTLYNAMIAPLQPYGLRGVIWYQGESNAGRAEQYGELFPDMIQGWRKTWGQGDFPFLFVQLAPFKAIQSEPGESDWAELREAQRITTRVLPQAGMAVITDVGDEQDIHPQQKKPVGQRLALAARALAYGEPIEYSGPVYREHVVAGDRIALYFDHVGGGLEQRGDKLTGFAVCGKDRQWKWARAEILADDVVVVWSEEVMEPVAVRFGWADYPVVNLWNKEGLPATPFRTDDFPLTTTAKPR